MHRNVLHPVVVLGAGLAGSCTALELARRGIEVILLDQDERPMNRASLRNEGKIHLGLCYANDETLQTTRIQLQGALTFRHLLNQWIGDRSERLRLSTPFVYAVAHDSVLNAEELSQRYAAMEDLYRGMIEGDPELDYFGKRPEHLVRRMDGQALANNFNSEQITAGFVTEEVAIDPAQLAEFVRDAIEESPNITFVPGIRVSQVSRTSNGFLIRGSLNGADTEMRALQVINATWEGRLVLDKGMGVLRSNDYLHRLKYRVIARLPEGLQGGPSVTMVIGRYGDVVIRPDGTAYLSWYPSGLQGWTSDLEPPESWRGPCRGEVDTASAQEIAGNIVREIESWYPGIRNVEVLEIDAGAIVACGTTDVDDKSSELHKRTAIGVTSDEGYHSLDPGKLTTAPMYAAQAAERVVHYFEEFAAQASVAS